VADPVFTKLGMYANAAEPIPTAYFINPFPSVCVYIFIPLWLLGNGSVKTSLSPLGNGSVEALPRQRTHTQQWKKWWTRFLCCPCYIKESRWVVLPRTCYLSYCKDPKPSWEITRSSVN
jgi:hypothetical protein